jgi:dTDP-4-amino-4,6-dideoxygalactose transaminase
VLKLRPGVLRIDRDQFIRELKSLGIGTSVHLIPLHVHPYYGEAFGYTPGRLPVALNLYQGSVSLPISSRMTDAEVARVVQAVRDVVLETVA